MNAYDLETGWKELQTLLEDSGGEVTDEIQALMDKLAQGSEASIEQACRMKENAEGRAAACKYARERLASKEAQAYRTAARMEEFIMKILELNGAKRITTPLFDVRLQKNSAPSIKWMGEPEAIPPGFRVEKVTVSVDTEKAHDAFKAGTLPEGFTAHHGSHLRIK